MLESGKCYELGFLYFSETVYFYGIPLSREGLFWIRVLTFSAAVADTSTELDD